MVFHQNGATLTEFAKSCTSPEATGWTRIGFNVWALTAIFIGVYALFNLFQTRSNSGRAISALILAAVAGALVYIYNITPEVVEGIQPQQYQQFNPFYVVALTPVSLALFGWLASRKKEPSAPRKIGYGMVMAGIAYGVMVIGSLGLAGTQGSRIAQLADFDLSVAHVCRAAVVAYGYLLRVKGGSSQVQGCHDGRMVCSYGHR